MSTSTEKTDLGAWSFYLVFMLSLLFEGSIVHVLGLRWGMIALWAGGACLGFFALAFTDPAKKAPDPFFKASIWLLSRWPRAGYIPMVLMAGSPGTAVAYKKLKHRHAKTLTCLASLIFAAVWAPIFYYIWR